MKKILLSLMSFGLVLSAIGQENCSRKVSTFGTSSGDYIVKGSATLIDSNGVVYLTTSPDFFTDAGPDLHFYLAIKDAPPTTPGNTNLLVAPLQSNSGAQTYIVPGDVSLSDYDHILVHCKRFNHFWDGGTMGGEECQTAVGIFDNNADAVKVYPNPTNGILTVDTQKEITNVVLYNKLGKKVLESNDKSLDLNTLPTGQYFLKATLNKGEVLQQIVVKQ